MYCDFATTTYGKWILAGEHAVLRGHGALVFPVKSKQLHVRYSATHSPLQVTYTGTHGTVLEVLLCNVLEHGMQLLDESINVLSGHFTLENTIPVGVGMGASAALCVAISRWFCAQGLVGAQDIPVFAKELEHVFHGKSSGLDVAGVSSEDGVYFQAGVSMPLKQVIYPKWYLSSCNQIGITSECVQHVQRLWETDPLRAEALDKQMLGAVQEAKRALEDGEDDAMLRLAQAINRAADCFYQWGLVSEVLDKHMHEVLAQGAVAVKPTGSGGGGFVLSLWDKIPPKALDLVAV